MLTLVLWFSFIWPNIYARFGTTIDAYVGKLVNFANAKLILLAEKVPQLKTLSEKLKTE